MGASISQECRPNGRVHSPVCCISRGVHSPGMPPSAGVHSLGMPPLWGRLISRMPTSCGVSPVCSPFVPRGRLFLLMPPLWRFQFPRNAALKGASIPAVCRLSGASIPSVCPTLGAFIPLVCRPSGSVQSPVCRLHEASIRPYADIMRRLPGSPPT